ncbi:MAG: sensor domain-containing diguanylate cyclase [Anaerovoracaceae bacterium]|jgi:diguanylate cyclase (GGDEF)-like protein/PAS domain S-box-containing protein
MTIKKFNHKISTDLQKYRQIHAAHGELLKLISFIPGCVICCDANTNTTLNYYNQGFLDMFGYSSEDIKKKFNNQYRKLIYQEDLPSFDGAIRNQLNDGGIFDQIYRVVCKDGSLLWVHDRGNIVQKEDGTSLLYCMLMNISHQKNIEKELTLTLERYRIVMEQTSDVVFEWDLRTDTFECSKNWHDIFAYPPPGENFKKVIFDYPYLHADDRNDFLNFMLESVYDHTCVTSDFRFLRDEKDFIWCRIRCTLQRDSNDNIIKVIGVLRDINEEKHHLMLLHERASRDSLTNLYHKSATKTLIEDALQSLKDDYLSAMLLIDIDNFKDINDNFGHPVGDEVLEDIATFLKGMIRSGDILGRIGGDEFIVLLRDVNDLSAVSQKSKTILKVFSSYENRKLKGFCLSCSIGISMAPSDGTTFAQLYTKADIALYQAKKKGKNLFAFYSPQS